MTRSTVAHLVETDDEGRTILIDRNADPKRINGLIWEDRARTLTLFPAYAMPLHPQAPVDMPPELDLVQGIATQVKSFKAKRGSRDKLGRLIGTIGMACSYNLMKLVKHIRLIIGIYEIERKLVDGVMSDVMIFHTVIEIILSPATLKAFHAKKGTAGVSIEEMKKLRDDMADFEIGEDTKEEAKRIFRPIILEMRKRMGIAKVHWKIDGEQCRPQTTVPLAALATELKNEGDYHGKQIQVNYKEYHEGDVFHGLALPWRTVGKERVFLKPRDPDRKRQRRRRKPNEAEVAASIATEESEERVHDMSEAVRLATPFGEVSVVTHEDGMRTLRAESPHAPDRRQVSLACNAACRRDRSRWLNRERAWLLDATQEISAIQYLRRLPSAEGASAMIDLSQDGSRRKIRTDDGPVTVLRLPRDNYALRHDNVRAVEERIHATCRAHAVGAYYIGRYGGNWLIPQEPPELMERVALAIQNYHAPPGSLAETKPDAALR